LTFSELGTNFKLTQFYLHTDNSIARKHYYNRMRNIVKVQRS